MEEEHNDEGTQVGGCLFLYFPLRTFLVCSLSPVLVPLSVSRFAARWRNIPKSPMSRRASSARSADAENQTAFVLPRMKFSYRTAATCTRGAGARLQGFIVAAAKVRAAKVVSCLIKTKDQDVKAVHLAALADARAVAEVESASLSLDDLLVPRAREPDSEELQIGKRKRRDVHASETAVLHLGDDSSMTARCRGDPRRLGGSTVL